MAAAGALAAFAEVRSPSPPPTRRSPFATLRTRADVVASFLPARG